jgi:hypothetical protein
MNATDSVVTNAAVHASVYEGDVLRTLSDFESLTGRLHEGERVFDTYELESKAGDQVRLRLTSEDFRVVAFVVLRASTTEPRLGPFVRKVMGGADRTTGGVEAEAPITLPAAGTYRLVVTSIENETQQRAVSTGEYRMTLLVDTPKNASPNVPPGAPRESLPGLRRTEAPRPVASPSVVPEAPDAAGPGPGSQKGARFNDWESDSA